MSENASEVAIVFEGVELFVRLGAHPWEKFAERPTRLLVDLTLSFGYRDYFTAHGGYVDYDPLRAFLKSLERADHVDTFEELAQTILAAVFRLTPAARAHLALLKPDIFPEVAGVGLRFDVARADFSA